jgi:hypothetical protein
LNVYPSTLCPSCVAGHAVPTPYPIGLYKNIPTALSRLSSLLIIAHMWRNKSLFMKTSAAAVNTNTAGKNFTTRACFSLNSFSKIYFLVIIKNKNIPTANPSMDVFEYEKNTDAKTNKVGIVRRNIFVLFENFLSSTNPIYTNNHTMRNTEKRIGHPNEAWNL